MLKSLTWVIIIVFLLCLIIAIATFVFISLPFKPLNSLPANVKELCYELDDAELGSDYMYYIKAKLNNSEFDKYLKNFPELLKINNLDGLTLFGPSKPIWWDLSWSIDYVDCYGLKVKDGQTVIIYYKGYMYYFSYQM